MKRRTQSEITSILERYRTSGLAQRIFCEREGIKLPTFSSWLRRQGSESGSMGTFTELSSASPVLEGLEVVFPNGLLVRGIRDLSVLERLLSR